MAGWEGTPLGAADYHYYYHHYCNGSVGGGKICWGAEKDLSSYFVFEAMSTYLERCKSHCLPEVRTLCTTYARATYFVRSIKRLLHAVSPQRGRRIIVIIFIIIIIIIVITLSISSSLSTSGCPLSICHQRLPAQYRSLVIGISLPSLSTRGCPLRICQQRLAAHKRTYLLL